MSGNDNSTDIPQELRDLAAGIADDIERQGHYQRGVRGKGIYNPAQPDGRCCLLANPHVQGKTEAVDLAGKWFTKLLPSVPMDRDDFGMQSIFGFIRWQDRVPTSEVVDALRKIAAGERP